MDPRSADRRIVPVNRIPPSTIHLWAAGFLATLCGLDEKAGFRVTQDAAAATCTLCRRKYFFGRMASALNPTTD